MQDIRYSVMVLPRCNNSILLQSFTNYNGDVFWDGFGSFYEPSMTPLTTALKVISDNFKFTLPVESLHESANVQYFINKPTGLVDLRVTIYFADVNDDLVITDQMSWFNQAKIPYQQMHQATGKWLPIIFESSNLITVVVNVEQPGDHTAGRVTEFTVN